MSRTFVRGKIPAAAVLLAVLFFSRAVFPLPAEPGPAQTAPDLARRGREAQLLEESTRAIELYRAALALNPSYLEALVGLAETFFMMEEYDEALRCVETARRYDRRSLPLRILEGRTCIALGQLERAAGLFTEVLQAEPNNLEARFGMAELDIASGRITSAASRYLESLRYAPENRKALLALAKLREAEGDLAEAGRYLELALRLHSGDAEVQLAAGYFAWRGGRFEEAEHHLLTALSLKPDWKPARLALAEVHLSQERTGEAISRLRQMLGGGDGDSRTWYLLGLAYDRHGDAERAVSSLSNAVRLRADDEIARIALEDVIRRKTADGDPARAKYSAYHLERGRLLEERHFLEAALFEYRRSLLLEPLAASGQYAFARIFLTRGYPEMYIDKLRMLKERGFERVGSVILTDEIEVLGSKTADRLSAEWGVDQYSLSGYGPRTAFTLSIYTLPARNDNLHRDAGDLLTRYWIENLQRNEHLEIREEPTSVSTFDEAFRRSRDNGSDYFLLLGVEETERSITLQADLHLASTGSLLFNTRVFRTGNDRVREATLALSQRIEPLFPLRGRLLERRFRMGLIDQGRMSGLSEGQKLLILRRGSSRLDHERVGLLYEPADVLGELEITRVDEKVAEGRVLPSGFFDRINPGDLVIRAPAKAVPEEAAAPEPAPAERSGLLRRIHRLIGQ